MIDPWCNRPRPRPNIRELRNSQSNDMIGYIRIINRAARAALSLVLNDDVKFWTRRARSSKSFTLFLCIKTARAKLAKGRYFAQRDKHGTAKKRLTDQNVLFWSDVFVAEAVGASESLYFPLRGQHKEMVETVGLFLSLGWLQRVFCLSSRPVCGRICRTSAILSNMDSLIWECSVIRE